VSSDQKDACESLQVKERNNGFFLYSGEPGPSVGHKAKASSYFDRLWSRDSRHARFVLFVGKGPSPASTSNDSDVPGPAVEQKLSAPPISKKRKARESKKAADRKRDLSSFKSPQELEALGLEVLKEELTKWSCKCSGTLSERAARLWKLRDVKGKLPDALKYLMVGQKSVAIGNKKQKRLRELVKKERTERKSKKQKTATAEPGTATILASAFAPGSLAIDL
jgi:hypothetical protein